MYLTLSELNNKYPWTKNDVATHYVGVFTPKQWKILDLYAGKKISSDMDVEFITSFFSECQKHTTLSNEQFKVKIKKIIDEHEQKKSFHYKYDIANKWLGSDLMHLLLTNDFGVSIITRDSKFHNFIELLSSESTRKMLEKMNCPNHKFHGKDARELYLSGEIDYNIFYRLVVKASNPKKDSDLQRNHSSPTPHIANNLFKPRDLTLEYDVLENDEEICLSKDESWVFL